MVAVSDLAIRKLTGDEVLQMVEAGILSEEEPVELLDGRLIAVAPQGPTHLHVSVIVHQLLADRYRGIGYCQAHSSIRVGPHSLPEPDVAVVRGDPRQRMLRLATGEDVILAVEVVQTTQRESRAKLPIYARGRLPVVWLVDIPRRRLEVSSGPQADGQYARTETLEENDTVPLPELSECVQVAALLP